MNWCQAVQYCEWLGKRLPTEAEWEMGASGSCEKTGFLVGSNCSKSMRIYPWGDESATCDYAVMFEEDGGCETYAMWAVGSKSPTGDSPYGLQDMSGNAWEQVQDCYVSYSSDAVTSPTNDSCGEPDAANCTGNLRVVRGSGFLNLDKGTLRASDRYIGVPSYAIKDQGFRCAKSIP